MEVKLLTFDNIEDFIKFLKENFDVDEIADIIEQVYQVKLDEAIKQEEYEEAVFYRDLINAAVKLVEE